jgi:hypothetical protein
MRDIRVSFAPALAVTGDAPAIAVPHAVHKLHRVMLLLLHVVRCPGRKRSVSSLHDRSEGAQKRLTADETKLNMSHKAGAELSTIKAEIARVEIDEWDGRHGRDRCSRRSFSPT